MMRKIGFLAIALILVLYVFCHHRSVDKNSDRIANLSSLKTRNLEFAGYLHIPCKSNTACTKSTSNKIFYYLNLDKANTTRPVILWLNGGPGASDMYGVFTENGPYTIASDHAVKTNPVGWYTKYNYLSVDQPIGVGFSYSNNPKYIAHETEVSTIVDLYFALVAFYVKYPQLLHVPLYIAGESYAGRYIPEIAKYIIDHNGSPHIPLKGIMIGDGWVNPLLQQSQDGEYAYSHGLIDYNQKNHVDYLYGICKKAILAKSPTTVYADHVCGNIVDYIESVAKIDLHNIIKSGNDQEYAMLEHYLNLQSTQNGLHAHPTHFVLMSDDVSNALEIGEQDSSATLFPYILNHGIKVLIYNGISDAMDCNFLGTSLWLRNLNYGQFNISAQNVLADKSVHTIGWIKQYGNLSYVKLRNAGHMAPEDAPKSVLYMLDYWIHSGN